MVFLALIISEKGQKVLILRAFRLVQEALLKEKVAKWWIPDHVFFLGFPPFLKGGRGDLFFHLPR